MTPPTIPNELLPTQADSLQAVKDCIAELGFAGRDPAGYPGATARCVCCGQMADKWTTIWSFLVGDCCFAKVVTPETPRRLVVTTPYVPKRWMW